MLLDQESLLAYQRRWQAVEQVVNAERQNATIAERWRKVNSLLRMAVTLGLQVGDDEPQIDLADQHWNRLRTMYLAGRPKESL